MNQKREYIILEKEEKVVPICGGKRKREKGIHDSGARAGVTS